MIKPNEEMRRDISGLVLIFYSEIISMIVHRRTECHPDRESDQGQNAELKN